MEQLLHYAWKHRMFPLAALTTTDGKSIEIIDSGLHNRNAGPDFFNAKVRIDNTVWVGNVEIHDSSKGWYLHGHDHDKAYDNVVLHVAKTIDCDVFTSEGRYIPQMQMDVPQRIADNYYQLQATESYPPCYRIIPDLSRLTVHSWMAALQTERLEQKTKAIEHRVKLKDGSWEDAYFVTLARNFGFGINGDAFEQWALNVPLGSVAHHRDDLFQIEAIFMGQAGLLSDTAVSERYMKEAMEDGYLMKMRDEYKYLSHKFGLIPLDSRIWRFMRLRPQNFPHIRISQLANLYYERTAGLSSIIECNTMAELTDVLKTHVTPYWETHYTFGSESIRNTKNLSPFSFNLLIINTVVPVLFAYGKHIGSEMLCNRAFDFLESIKAENNSIIRMWRDCGMDVESAGDSQALIQLKKEYCDRKDCLRCRFGYEYLKR
ncbi:DUF2851 family protein [Xylanibacter muris]|uniref:DUF2851 family protein n=1 Tax=Xylanibacter muris TaxID=2736290 RepID=A0ABX2AJZ3_9BACT|nr:DUF2851 family protein [Xylanibacter muris]NPD90827.1 DUF2851 family protein [Xylanibacter muris]